MNWWITEKTCFRKEIQIKLTLIFLIRINSKIYSPFLIFWSVLLSFMASEFLKLFVALFCLSPLWMRTSCSLMIMLISSYSFLRWQICSGKWFRMTNKIWNGFVASCYTYVGTVYNPQILKHKSNFEIYVTKS